MKRISIVLILFLNHLTTTAFAQDVSRRQTAQEQIYMLKNGVLLVRLNTKKQLILALRQRGNTKQADVIEQEVAKYNIEIVKAFKANFDFCPTYFFYIDYANNVENREFNKVVFLNAELQPDTATKEINNKPVFTAEFGNIEQEGRLDMGFGALIIKDDRFVQLNRPFPFYVRTFDSLIIERSTDKTVQSMNYNLHKFYDKEKG